MKHLVIALLLLLAGQLLSRQYVQLDTQLQKPAFSVLQSNETATTIKVELPGFYLKDTLRQTEQFQQIEIPDFGATLEEGLPQLPQFAQLVGIDWQGDYTLTIESVDYREFNNINVFPAQPQPTRKDEVLPWTYNAAAYQSNQWIPEKMVMPNDPAILRDYRVLPVSLYPVQFLPAQQKIRVAKSIVFRVEKSSSSGINEKSQPAQSLSPAFTSLYRAFIVNYSQLNQTRGALTRGMPDMLIITHDAYYNQVMQFAEWKNQKGVYTKVVKTSEIGASPTNTQIKSYIQNYYDNASDKPDYLLIVGDVTGANAVPWFTVGPDKSDMPYYYLEGNDILADISGGRISVQTTAEAGIVFSKLIRYEKNPYLTDPDWFHSTLIINSNDFQDPSSGNWANAQMTGYGFNPIHHIGDNMGNATVANVYSAVNSGVSYIYYIGHGAPTYWVTTGFSTTHIPALVNGEMQPVISSVACNNADLDEPNDVFAEVWLKNSMANGSVGIMAFTESCAVYETDTLARGMLRAVISDTVTAFGDVINYGRLHMFQNYGSSCSEPMHQSILIGEPELQVWTKTPEPLTVNAPGAAFFGIPFNVQVTDGNGPVADALVCYWDSLGNQVRAFTDANGEVIMNHGVASPVSGTITVSGHNKIPAQTSIEILPPQGPYVMAKQIMANDSIGNNNHILESGEHVYLDLMLENIGVDPTTYTVVVLESPDTNIVFLSDSVDFGPLASGDTIIGGNYEAMISQSCSHRYQIPVQITIKDGQQTLFQQKYLMVRQGAHIELSENHLDFPNTFLNFTSTLPLEISNTGPDTLFIDELTADIPQYSVQESELVVAPGATRKIHVDFTPDTTLQYPGTVTLRNSDPVNFVQTFTTAGTGIYAPQIVAPDSIIKDMAQTDSTTLTITVDNSGLGDLNFNAMIAGYDPNGAVLEGAGGSDTYGHMWIDSDEPSGPSFDWIDITGTSPLMLTGNNSITNPLSIGFTFPFYGEPYDQVRVCTNGWISFTTFSVAYNNFQLPSNLAPRAMIAPLWDNLNFTQDSKAYFENQGNKAVILYEDVYTVTGEGPYTFEVILYENGNVVLQYKEMQNVLTDYTVGIQNHLADDGLTIAHNTAYVHDSLAVMISKHSWVTVTPMSGVIAAQGSQDLQLTFKTHNFPMGDFWASLQIESNDPASQMTVIPIHMKVGLVGIDEMAQTPQEFRLYPNSPNPFNPATVIRYQLPQAQDVRLEVYNMLGQRVCTLVKGRQQASAHEVQWDGTNDAGVQVASGIYIYRLQAGKQVATRKMILMK
ncbi:MAG: C25 family cysteine peptidase [Calditrichia bacterium]